MSEPVYDFDTLCTPHYQALVKYANRLLPGRHQEALDLVQEAFLRALKMWHKWSPSTGEDPSQAARGWLHRVVQNVCFDQNRARKGHHRLLDDNHAAVVTNTYGVESDHNIQVLSDGVGDEVRQALDMLEADQRDVVVRADFGGEQYLTIAENLGIPLGTVMSRLHRGRKRLAAALQSYAKDEYGIARRPAKFAEGTKTDIKPAPESDGAGTTEIPDSTCDDLDSVLEPPEGDVAVYTQKPAHLSGGVAVVDVGSTIRFNKHI